LSVRASLARQNTVLLALAFVVVELLAAAAFALFLMLPLAQRYAADLAGLMALSAQTWAELPTGTRAAFEVELRRSHDIALRAEPANGGADEWHPPFYYLLERALDKRAGTHHHLVKENIGGTVWYWANLPSGDGMLAVGLPQERVETQPLAALVFTLLGGLALAIVSAWWLARRITAPLARLKEAATRLGQGRSPELLPETGPLELAALAQRFNAMARQVQELMTARTTLLAGVSHDLRTPLSRMRLALEILRTDPVPGLIERLEKDVEEMSGLIGTLLDLARGLNREAPVDTDLRALLNELGEDFSTPERSVDVRCSACMRAVPPRALRRAIGNLLQNALRYAPEGPIELTCDNQGTACAIAVLDRGPGIVPERIEEMFQPFHRLEASRSPATGGAGLGLAIVRELARANGWKVALAPRPGGGLAATLLLEPVETAAPA
jgi:two-component system osmolarity sensor histidine kinase EnvZ